jgi:hypothetical protein
MLRRPESSLELVRRQIHASELGGYEWRFNLDVITGIPDRYKANAL